MEIAVRAPYGSRFLWALFQFSKRAASEVAKFGRGGFEVLGVAGAARLECDELAAEAGELIRRQLGDSFGDLFDFHAAQYNTIEARRTDLDAHRDYDLTACISEHAPE